MISPLLLSTALAICTIFIHMAGLSLLMAMMHRTSPTLRPHQSRLRQAVFIVVIVLGLFVIHAVEIWLYAGAYIWVGALDALEPALYFSTSTFTTLGYGDVTLDEDWRLVAAIEGFNGFLLIGWSTAYLVTVIGRLRALEHGWLDQPNTKP
jgi:hypothetical protein